MFWWGHIELNYTGNHRLLLTGLVYNQPNGNAPIFCRRFVISSVLQVSAPCFPFTVFIATELDSLDCLWIPYLGDILGLLPPSLLVPVVGVEPTLYRV